MKKIIVLLLVIISMKLGAFANGVDTTMDTVMKSWMGYSLYNVIDRWGYPDTEKAIADHKLYIWKTLRTVTTPPVVEKVPHKTKFGRTYYTTVKKEGTDEVYTTERIIEVDENNKVVRGKYSGNDLPFALIGLAMDWLNPEYISPKIVESK